MKTQRLRVDPLALDTEEAKQTLDIAVEILRSGGLVAFPTETVYGLGANALDAEAVGRIFRAKQRPSWDPIIVHIAGPLTGNRMLESLVSAIPAAAHRLMDTFWPGPLTLLLPRSKAVPDAVTAGRPLVGVRMPSHRLAHELIVRAGLPIAAPSANQFSHISPTTADHVLEDLDGRIDAILDAGPAEHGVESTVLDPNESPMRIYRPGAVTEDEIRASAGAVEVYQARPVEPNGEIAALPSPGVGIRHYAPRAHLVLVDAPRIELSEHLEQVAALYPDAKVGIMLPADVQFSADGRSIFRWGRWDAPEEMARLLYSGLRFLDAEGCGVILCPVPPEDGIGAAILDRLRKAARTT